MWIAVLLAGFVFAEIYACGVFIENFTFVEFGLVVSLAGGLLEQGTAADSQASVIVLLILQNICGNFLVSILITKR